MERYPGNGQTEDLNGRVTYYYDSHPFQTDFVGQYRTGRLAAIEYKTHIGSGSYGTAREFYSYTRGGRLTKKRLELGAGKLDVSFEYDAEAKMEYMVYPSGKRVRYTYDDLARHTGLKEVNSFGESDIVNNLTYGAAGELKSMSWLVSGTQWATQNWDFNNRLQMKSYGYAGPGGPVGHEYKYSETQNDGKLWRRHDTVSGEIVEYQYDSIHRLASASVLANTGDPAKSWGQAYTYDGFGNLAQKTDYRPSGVTNSPLQPTMNSARNGGNVNGDSGDMDNRLLALGADAYGYAPDNKRILKKTGSTTHTYVWVGGMQWAPIS